MIKSAMRGVITTLLSAVTSGESNPLVIPDSYSKHTFYIRGSNGVSAGAIQISTTSDPSYAGTWAPYSSPVTVVSNSEVVVNISAPSIFRAFKVTVSTPVVDGTVSVYYLGAS